MRAGFACFFAMSYIIAVNSSIVAETGGNCVCNGGEEDPICDNNAEYLMCAQIIKRDLVTATAAISALSTFCMGLFANMCVFVSPPFRDCVDFGLWVRLTLGFWLTF